MRALIAEDDYTSRVLIQRLLAPYADCKVVVNGADAVVAFREAIESGQRFDLICLDVLMPEMDGHTALAEIRKIEQDSTLDNSSEAVVIMTTGVADLENVRKAVQGRCQGYLIKPFVKDKLLNKLESLGLLKQGAGESSDSGQNQTTSHGETSPTNPTQPT